MLELLQILATIILPIIIVAGLGLLIDRTRVIEPRTISQIVIYLASPALVFLGLATSSIDLRELGELTLFSLLSIGLMALLAWIVTRLMGLDRMTTSAFILSCVLINMVNYGLPVNEFAFGREGLERAIVFTVFQGIYANTLGIFLASSGKASITKSLWNMAKVPMPYAAALGLLFNLYEVSIPDLALKVGGILAAPAVPLMLLMLGIQISRATWRVSQLRVISAIAVVRLIGGAAVAFAVSAALGLDGVTHQVAILETAMPTAVIAGMMATEFESDAELTSSAILVTTVLSVFTLPIVILLLR